MESRNSEAVKDRLLGWKSIARHLGRTERAVQLWEEQRGLPVHRIPGLRGHTVYAYATELDSWMASGRAGHAIEPPVVDAIALVVQPDASIQVARPPGILVLPAERRADVDPGCSADSLCQQLIVRLAAAQPVRVLSWTTSRSLQLSTEPMDTIAARLNVRYLVESVVEHADAGLQVDVRVVDAELDQIVLADRFLVSGGTCSAAFADLADAVALHFALIHAGALVEPICLDDLIPAHFLSYLVAVRSFFHDADGGSGRALAALDRAVTIAPHFGPAQAMRGLALIQRSNGSDGSAALAEARAIFTTCRDQPFARVTTAFLGAAIARRTDEVESLHESLATMALRWIPPVSGRDGRLYERRSRLRRDGSQRSSGNGAIERRYRTTGSEHPFIDALLRALTTAGQARQMPTAGPVRTRMPALPCSDGQPACDPLSDYFAVTSGAREDGDVRAGIDVSASSPCAAAATTTGRAST